MSEVTSHLLTINDLLEFSGYPGSWMQGHHTRITKDESGTFYVWTYSNNSERKYTVNLYTGTVESVAVKAYLESEEN